jgi:hypothetical protein
MRHITLISSVLVIQLSNSGCGLFKKTKEILDSETCNYSDMLSCVVGPEKIEVTFTEFKRQETVEKCETTQQPETKTTVAFLMRAKTIAKVNDVEVDTGTKEQVAPGMQFDFDKSTKTYQYDETQDVHKILLNGVELNPLCVLYQLAEVPPKTPSSSGDSDFD